MILGGTRGRQRRVWRRGFAAPTLSGQVPTITVLADSFLWERRGNIVKVSSACLRIISAGEIHVWTQHRSSNGGEDGNVDGRVVCRDHRAGRDSIAQGAGAAGSRAAGGGGTGGGDRPQRNAWHGSGRRTSQRAGRGARNDGRTSSRACRAYEHDGDAAAESGRCATRQRCCGAATRRD